MNQTLTGIEDSDINVNSVTTSYLTSIPAKSTSNLCRMFLIINYGYTLIVMTKMIQIIKICLVLDKNL